MTSLKRHGMIPGPEPNLIFGNTLEILKHGTSQMFPKWAETYGPIVGFYIGGRPQVLISDIDLIRQVLITDHHKFSNRSGLIPGAFHPQLQFKNMMVWFKGAEYKQLRATIAQSLSNSKVNKLEPLMTRCVEIMLRNIAEVPENCEFDFRSYAEELSFSVDVNCLMGVDLSMRHSKVAESIAKSVRVHVKKSVLAMVMAVFPSLTFIVYPLRICWETIRLNMMWADESVLFETIKEIIRARKAKEKIMDNSIVSSLLDCEIVPSTKSSDDPVVPSTNSRKTKRRLSAGTILANTFLLFLGAFESNAITLMFVVSDLVNNPDVQTELRNQLKKKVALNGGVANFQAFSKVPLLLNVIMESLRMHTPTSPLTTRVADEDYEYEGLMIPKGTSIFLNVVTVHNDPQLWSEPDKYKPERFSDDYNKLAFLPFGAG